MLLCWRQRLLICWCEIHHWIVWLMAEKYKNYLSYLGWVQQSIDQQINKLQKPFNAWWWNLQMDQMSHCCCDGAAVETFPVRAERVLLVALAIPLPSFRYLQTCLPLTFLSP
jgi:hypothetical protein